MEESPTSRYTLAAHLNYMSACQETCTITVHVACETSLRCSHIIYKVTLDANLESHYNMQKNSIVGGSSFISNISCRES
jgi:hypothetical protein